MKINEFVAKKDNVLNHITTKYVPLTEKVARAKIITDSCYFVNGKFQPNTVLFDATVNMTLLLSYTDLELSGDNVSFSDDYDAMNKLGVFQTLEKEISKKEYSEFIKIIESQKADVEMQYNSPQIYVENQIDKLLEIIKTGLNGIDWEQLKNLDLNDLKNIKLD